MTKLIILVHFASTWYLVGLCWLVQRVQYPLMAQVGAENYRAYEQGHVTQIGPVVAPMMLIEVASAIALFSLGGAEFRRPLFGLSLGLLALIWCSTFLIQVPLHQSLGEGFDVSAHASLVRTNWIRTLAWTARGLIVGVMLYSRSADSSGLPG